MYVNAERKRGAAPLDPQMLEQTGEVLRVLAHPQRLRILDYLVAVDNAPVHEVMAQLDLPQTTVSQHLGLLRRLGLVRAARRGREKWYGVADPRVLTILGCIRKRGART